MILGRSPVLWYALTAALLNLVVLLGVVHLDNVQLGSANAAMLALLGVIANERDPLAVGTLAATVHSPAVAAPTSSSATASSPLIPPTIEQAIPSIVSTIDPALAKSVISLLDRLTQPAQPAPTPTTAAPFVPLVTPAAIQPTPTVAPVSVAPVSAQADVTQADAPVYPPADENHTR